MPDYTIASPLVNNLREDPMGQKVLQLAVQQQLAALGQGKPGENRAKALSNDPNAWQNLDPTVLGVPESAIANAAGSPKVERTDDLLELLSRFNIQPNLQPIPLPEGYGDNLAESRALLEKLL